MIQIDAYIFTSSCYAVNSAKGGGGGGVGKGIGSCHSQKKVVNCS